MARKEKGPSDLAELWIEARFHECDEIEKDSFRENVARVLDGEDLIDDFGLDGRLQNREPKLIVCMHAVLLEIERAIKNGETPPIPRRQKTPLVELIDRLPEGAAKHIMQDFRGYFGSEFAPLPVSDADLIDASNFLVASLDSIMRRAQKDGVTSSIDLDFVASLKTRIGFIFYAFNRFDLVRKYFLEDHRTETLALIWRRAHDFGGLTRAA